MAQMPSISADPVLAHVITPVTVCGIADLVPFAHRYGAEDFCRAEYCILHDDELGPRGY